MRSSIFCRIAAAALGSIMALVLSAGCSGTKGAEAAANTLKVSVAEGQLMSIISVLPRGDDASATARRNYLASSSGLATRYGLKPLGNLTVSGVVAGEFAPRAVVFYSWPSAAAERQFEDDPDWPPIKARRADGWDDLRIHDQVEPSDVTLQFSSAKFYTMATAWINPDKPEDYDRYLANIEPAVGTAGGRFIYQMVDPAFASMDAGTPTPGRVTFVEWNSPKGLDAFLKSDGYARNASLVRSGTTRFEVIGLSVPPARSGR